MNSLERIMCYIAYQREERPWGKTGLSNPVLPVITSHSSLVSSFLFLLFSE